MNYRHLSVLRKLNAHNHVETVMYAVGVEKAPAIDAHSVVKRGICRRLAACHYGSEVGAIPREKRSMLTSETGEVAFP